MKAHRFRPWIAFTGLALLIGVLSIQPTRSQTGSDSAQIAVANDVNQHIHTLGFRTSDLNAIISSLGGADDSVEFETSSGYDGGAPNGQQHSHDVQLTKSQLEQLRDTGTVSVETENSLNHTHTLVFYSQAQCAAMGTLPAGGPSPGPSPSISGSPSPSPSGSPSGVPSGAPSGAPSGSPGGTPSGTPTGTPTGGAGGSAPTPGPTFSIPPINIPDLPLPFVRQPESQ